MTRVDVQLGPWTRPLLALVLPHGLTDLSKRGVFGRYACWLTLPLPSALVTVLFCLASGVHLGKHSMLIHALVHEVYRVLGPSSAFQFFTVYFATIHTPQHYHTEITNGNAPLVCLCGAATALLLWLDLDFALTDAMQRLVIAHVVTVEVDRRNH